MPPTSFGRAQRTEQRMMAALGHGGRWLISSRLRVDGADIDHIVVAPSALLAVANLYPRSLSATGRDERYEQALTAATVAAGHVRRILALDQLDDRCPVFPTLIVWGDTSPNLPGGCRRDGEVWVLDGRCPQRWAHLLDAGLLSRELRRRLHESVNGRADLSRASGQPRAA